MTFAAGHDLEHIYLRPFLFYLLSDMPRVLGGLLSLCRFLGRGSRSALVGARRIRIPHADPGHAVADCRAQTIPQVVKDIAVCHARRSEHARLCEVPPPGSMIKRRKESLN